MHDDIRYVMRDNARRVHPRQFSLLGQTTNISKDPHARFSFTIVFEFVIGFYWGSFFFSILQTNKLLYLLFPTLFIFLPHEVTSHVMSQAVFRWSGYSRLGTTLNMKILISIEVSVLRCCLPYAISRVRERRTSMNDPRPSATPPER